MEILVAECEEEALRLLSTYPDAAPLAGATDLFVARKQGALSTSTLVDISHIDALREVQIGPEQASLGAAVTAAELERWELPPALRCLKQAAASLGGPQVRNRATLGGNVQTASPAGDLSIALLALGASLVLAGTGGVRAMPLREFFLGVKRTAKRENELIRKIEITYGPQAKSTFYKVGQRNSLSISTVSLAAVKCGRNYTLAFGAVGPTPSLAWATAECLRSDGPDRVSRACECLRTELAPIDDVRASAAYRLACAEGLLVQAVREMEGTV